MQLSGIVNSKLIMIEYSQRSSDRNGNAPTQYYQSVNMSCIVDTGIKDVPVAGHKLIIGPNDHSIAKCTVLWHKRADNEVTRRNAIHHKNILCATDCMYNEV